MRTSIHLAFAAVMFAAPVHGQATSNSASAAKPPIPAGSPALVRKGLWVSAGLGAGDAKLHCGVCDSDQPSRGTAGYARIGTTISPFFLVGVEASGWLRNDDEANHHIVTVTGDAYSYPNIRHGYYL